MKAAKAQSKRQFVRVSFPNSEVDFPYHDLVFPLEDLTTLLLPLLLALAHTGKRAIVFPFSPVDKNIRIWWFPSPRG
jgi:hypothetical protein